MSDAIRAPFDIGRVIERLFGTLARNFLVFFGLALILTGLPAAAIAWATWQRAAGEAAAALPTAGLLGLGTLVGAITSFVLQAAIVHGAVMDLNGRKPTFGDCLSGGLGRFFPVLAVSILMTVALVFGFLLLIVPGVLMLLAWAVAIPVTVVERRGIFGAFGRSGDLTRGHRGVIFLLLILWLVVASVIGVAVGALTLALAAGGSGQGALIGQMIASPISNALSAVISGVGVATLYAELRRAKEGVEPDQLAAIFD